MRRITALRRAGRDLVEVALDGEPWRKLPAEVVLTCRLTPGLELDRQRLRQLRGELRRVESLATAGRLLRHRELGAGRLEGELARRGIAPAQRAQTIATLSRTGLLDDRRVAARQAQALAERGYGDEAIRWRLAQAGIGEELAGEALAELAPEPARAANLVERHGLSPKTVQLLIRRGFGEDTVASVADTTR